MVEATWSIAACSAALIGWPSSSCASATLRATARTRSVRLDVLRRGLLLERGDGLSEALQALALQVSLGVPLDVRSLEASSSSN